MEKYPQTGFLLRRTHTPAMALQLGTFLVTRMITNTGYRMVYPFLPVIARGLGVELEAVALAVTARSSLGLISPVFGSLADRQGHRTAMLFGLACFVGSMLLIAVWPSYTVLFAALLIMGIGKLVLDPALYAYVGDHVRYARRGMAIAITEMSWSGAFLLGMPMIGWLIDRTDRWYAPFSWLAGLAVVAALVVWRVVPPEAVRPAERPSLVNGVRIVLAHPAALAGLAVGFLMCMANETIGIVYGAWMEDTFALEVAALGAASMVIGVAELSGEGLVAGIVDRLGKRRAVAGGVALNALACVLLPVIGVSIAAALVGLFLFYITFEFALVSLIPLMTELAPDARATLLAGNVAAFSAGRMVAALIGPPLFDVGLLANGAAAAAFNVVALVVLVVFVRQE
ncbi:MAG: MFS transporter [Anaerolineae bacterium]|nr:MFS transporter [Anaerolineae bacterium]